MEVAYSTSLSASNEKIISLQELEYTYEIAYLRVFVAWETFLEQTLYRLLCGYYTSNGPVRLNGNTDYCTSLQNAKQFLHGSRDYILWHNPEQVSNRAKVKLYQSNYATTIDSAEEDLVHYSNVRHRVVHDQEDGRRKFDIATMAMSGRRFRGSRPGRFLRYKLVNTDVNANYLDDISSSLIGLSVQIVS